MRAAAQHWQFENYSESLMLQTAATQYAGASQSSWPVLWSAAQIGICTAFAGEATAAREQFGRATRIAMRLGQPVVAGICTSSESLCALFADTSSAPWIIIRSLCSLHEGLMEYIQLNQLPHADMCWHVRTSERQAARWQGGHLPTRAQPEIRISTFGGFGICIGGRPIAGLPTGRSGALLRYLCTHQGQMLHCDELLETFWPEVDPEISRNRFHYTMHTLRRSLASACGEHDLPIAHSEGRYGFAPEQPVWMDTDSFRALIVRARHAERQQHVQQAIALYLEALAIYRGEFLPESRYESWAEASRTQLRDLHLGALERLGYLYVMVGNIGAAIDQCARLLEQDSSREDIHQRLMHCYIALGQRSQALQQYERCVQSLSSELGLEPLPETIQLYESIKGLAMAAA